MGEVINLSDYRQEEEQVQHRPTCLACSAAYIGRGGIYCATYDEFIDDDGCASECESYEIG